MVFFSHSYFFHAIHIVLKIGQQYSPIGNSVSIEIPNNLILCLFIYKMIELFGMFNTSGIECIRYQFDILFNGIIGCGTILHAPFQIHQVKNYRVRVDCKNSTANSWFQFNRANLSKSVFDRLTRTKNIMPEIRARVWFDMLSQCSWNYQHRNMF